MSTLAHADAPSAPLRFAQALADGATIAKRNLIKTRRLPDVLVWTTMSPIMFVLLFAYVFGGSIDIPGTSYQEFLIAGIFAQNIMFGASFTGVGLADDMQKGIIDRFRSLPMARSAVLFGRTASDLVNNAVAITVMSMTGLIVGWRIHTSIPQAIGGFLLLLLFAYAISWVMALVGLKVRSVEVVNNASFMVIFPMTFVANTFVPSQNLPTVLRAFAEWNPVSALAQAAREAFGNAVPYTSVTEAWSLNHPVAYVLLWVAAILLVFVPLAVREYARSATA